MFTRYESSAEVDIEVLARWENSAETEADGAYTVKNGAEEEVWSAMKWMTELNNTFVNASGGLTSGSSGEGWSVHCTGANEDGYATYYLEGAFSNPVVTLDCYAYFNYSTSSGEIRYADAGDLYIYTRTTSGTEGATHAADLGSSSGSLDDSLTINLTGEYDRIGFKVDLTSWSISSDKEPEYYVGIYNFCIDGKLCLPAEEHDF